MEVVQYEHPTGSGKLVHGLFSLTEWGGPGKSESVAEDGQDLVQRRAGLKVVPEGTRAWARPQMLGDHECLPRPGEAFDRHDWAPCDGQVELAHKPGASHDIG